MKKYFSHKLPTNDIIIREDSNSNSTQVESLSGKYFPLIRLNDVVFDFTSIDSFNLNFGIDYALPSIRFTISDDDYQQRDVNFVKKDDIVTIFIGNAQDEYHDPIKNNYYITEATVNNGIYNVKAVLDVKTLYLGTNRVFVDKSSLEVFKYIADECGLGFVSNITETNDRMNWIQYQSNIEFIKFVNARSYINDNTKIIVYVDQFANLTVVDVNQALTTPITTTFVTDINGELLEKEKDVTFRATNWYGEKENEMWSLVEDFSPKNLDGEYATKSSRIFNIKTIDYDNHESFELSIDSNKEQLKDSSTYTSITNSNTFPQYDYAKQINRNFNDNLLINEKVGLVFSNFYPQIFLFQTLYCEIFHSYRAETVESQEREVNSENFTSKVDMMDKSFKNIPNERFSTDYVIVGMSYSFSYNDEEQNQVKQNVTLLKK